MNSRHDITIERNLHRAELRWKWLRLLQYTLTLATLFSLVVLLFGVAVVAGFITSQATANVFFPLLGIVGFIAWLAILVRVFARPIDRGWVGAALEHVDRRLLDRLNTLLFLEGSREDSRSESFARRIEGQTRGVLADKPPPSPFRANRVVQALLAFVLVAGVTFAVYARYSPWDRLLAKQNGRPSTSARQEDNLSRDLPPGNQAEQARAWGEVRISEPGADLKVTKVDVVPLQIEAAASRAIKEVAWFSAVNGKAETRHPLPAPGEPQYGVYEPTIYLDELGLADWDVLSYYAKASAGKEESYGSEVYFLEVRPFREDVLKMPGGEGGKPYQALSEMSGLISRQQHVIRQTHQHIQKPPDQENVRNQDRRKLAAAESELGDSARHLYARMASQMENQPIGEALDNLAKAEQSLKTASTNLDTGSMEEAQRSERSALAELIAARKIFQKAVSDNPKAFDESSESDPSPVADSEKRRKEMAEFRNEAKAARDVVGEMQQQQRALQERAKSSRPEEFPGMAGEQRQLQSKLEDFQDQHPKVFKGAQQESQEARGAMRLAADSLHQGKESATAKVSEAGDSLDKLGKALEKQTDDQRLAEAYKLKQMLDQQIQTFAERAKPESSVPNSKLQKAVEEARQTLDQLKQSVDEPSTRDAFKKALREALSDQNKQELDAKLEKMRQAADEAAQQTAAQEVKNALGMVSKAFQESQPQSLQMAQQSDPLKQTSRDGLEQGMAELDSLIQQLRNGRSLSPEDQNKQGRQALANLQEKMSKAHPNDGQGAELLRQLEEILHRGAPLDGRELAKLLAQLKQFSVENLERLAAKEHHPELANIDIARLPPAYRGRIQTYFQKLSE